jgi:hypothetical protein
MMLNFVDHKTSRLLSWRRTIFLAFFVMVNIHGAASTFAVAPEPRLIPTGEPLKPKADEFRISPEHEAIPKVEETSLAAETTVPAVTNNTTQFYRKIGWWTIEVDGDACNMSAVYEDENMLMVTYNAKLDDLYLYFTNAEATSLKEGDERDIHMYFGGPENKNGFAAIKSEWENTDSTILVSKDGSRIFRLYLEAKDFFRDFGQYSGISFQTTDKVVIGNYKLNDSRAALNSLRKCAFEQAGLNLKDPFLK